jgi:multidrug efflux pump
VFARFFIDRPIFASVLSILLVLGGVVGLARLPVALYPEITPPTVEVSAVYPGANARDVVNTVAAPLEQQVNGVEGMMYMSSTSGNDGSYTLTVTFKPGTDLNIAQVLVQNRVDLAERVLPDIVRRRGVSVKKKSTGQLMIVNLYSPARTREDVYLSNYATIQLRDELARLEGVGDIQFLGQRDYSMRVWLDPDKLAARGLTAADAVRGIEQQNAQVAAGQIGQPPAPANQTFQYTINTLGRLEDPTQFADIILKTDADGRVVRMRDVTTKVELGAVGYDQTCTLDGAPSVALTVYQLPGANAIQTAGRVKDKLAELKTRFPEGVDYSIVYDTTPFIEESVWEVFKTLFEAVVLVAIVMLVFLQSWRAAIIPLAAVPVAIVGTFGAMALAGYSLNALSLFGLVLAVGIVVDDAIVVVEAVEHHIEEGETPRDATIAAMNEVAGPVIAVGLVLAAVFVPCLFISGIVGQFFRQFAVTIAISTLLSAFNSLTLSPALCALLLRPKDHGRVKDPLPRVAFPLAFAGLGFFLARHFAPQLAPVDQWLRGVAPVDFGPALRWLLPAVCGAVGFLAGWYLRIVLNRLLGWCFWAFNRAFAAVTAGYLGAVRGVLFATPLVLAGFCGLVYLTYEVMARSPVGFVPNQDKGYLLVNLQLPDSASLTRTDRAVRQVDDIARGIPGVRHTIAVAGQSQLLGANAPNFGTLYVMLEPFEDRAGDPERTADAVMAKLQAACDERVSDAVVSVFGAPPVDGLGATGGVKLMVEDRGNPDAKLLQATAEQVVAAAAAQPDLQNVFTGFRADTPWLELKFDREQAEATGVPVANVINDLQVLFGSLYVNDFNRFGRTWQVNVQADPRFRDDPGDPRRITVKTRQGGMVTLGGFVRVRETSGPVMITRYNLYPSAAVTARPAPGVSSGQAIAHLEGVANEKLPADMKAEWTELALLQLQSGSTAFWAFLLSVVLVFLVLAAQYESWALPLAVILVVPMCLLCAAVGVLSAGHDVNVFTQIGFVVLIGLACKNAILIVEYARTRHEGGASLRDATLEACRLRLRPIVMTSVAFILGVVPLLAAGGAAAEMRRLLGTAVFAGMIGVTAFGVFLTPAFFFAIQWATDKLRDLVNGAE